MFGRKNLQQLKALERAPQGTLALRSYLLKMCDVIPYNKTFTELECRRKEKLERVKKGLMNELLTGRKRIKAELLYIPICPIGLW